MNEKTILEGLFGWKIHAGTRGTYCLFKTGETPRLRVGPYQLSGLAQDKLIERYGSVQIAAEKAAEALIQKGYERVTRFRNGTWEIQPPSCLAVFWRTDIELIAEAVKAGWKGVTSDKTFILTLRCGGSLCKEEGRFKSRTQTESLRMARAAGWSVNLEADCPWCPKCKKTKRQEPTTWSDWHKLWKHKKAEQPKDGAS